MSSSRTILSLPNSPLYNIAGVNENDPRDWDAISIFRNTYKIPYFKHDQSKWDEGWEKTLSRLSASKDVFPVFKTHWLGDKSMGYLGPFHGTEGELRKRVDQLREAVVAFEEPLESSIFVDVWMLLGEGGRRRHLFDGIKRTCEHASTHYDGRALCPEITTSAMAERDGRAFLDFARDFVRGTKGAGVDEVYLPPSEWWSAAVKMPEPWPEEVELVFRRLSWQRNEFMSNFIILTFMSAMDMSVGGPRPRTGNGANPVQANDDPAPTLADSKHEKPAIRCEKCIKTSEQIEGNPKFMMCSSCKSKLNLVVYYCSRTCQKNDWPHHKKYCGKEKNPSKDILDRLHHAPGASTSSRLPAAVSDIGFGTPHPTNPHSPALQNQLSILERDKSADYYLFDHSDRPIRVALDDDRNVKLSFRTLRSQAMFAPAGAEQARCVEAMGEHLVKVMAKWPGLTRARILGQLGREYGGDMAGRVAAFEAREAEKGHKRGSTFAERMGGHVAGKFPGVVDRLRMV